MVLYKHKLAKANQRSGNIMYDMINIILGYISASVFAVALVFIVGCIKRYMFRLSVMERDS